MRKFFFKFGFTLNIGAVILLFLAYLAPFVPPDYFWPISFFGLFYPFVVVINVIFLIIWALQHSKRLLLPLISLVLGYSDFTNTIQLIPGSKFKDSGFEILSYNVDLFSNDKNNSRSNPPRILEYIKSVGAEIICLQEATLLKGGQFNPQKIKDALPEIEYFQLAFMNSYSGLITFSKYPMVNRGEIRFPGSSNLVLFSDIKISNRQTIRVYNCHLQSYSIDPDEYSIIDSIGYVSNSHQIDEASKISYKLMAGFRLRAVQARKVAEHIRKSPHPVVVCGDFNDTPVSYAYRKVRGNLKDAFIESGWGISNTYNGELPSFRIDYIMLDKKLAAGNYQRDLAYFSDHFPIHCQLNFK